MWLMTCASITAPRPQRNTSSARLIESMSALSTAGHRSGAATYARPMARSRGRTAAKVLGVLVAAAAGALAVQEARKRAQSGSAEPKGPIETTTRGARSAAMAGVGAKAGGAYALHRARRAFAS